MAKAPFRKKSKKKTILSGLGQERTTNRLHILVVDDNEGVGNTLKVYLSWCGHNVKAVNNGTEAIELSMNEDFDLVITDLSMPKVTGYDVIKALNGFDKRPKIILVSGTSEKFEPVKSEGLNVDFIVKKPFNLSRLARKINDIFEVRSR